MVCQCSGCGGWSGSGFLCEECREKDEKEALVQEKQKLENENRNLKKELNELKRRDVLLA